MAGIHNRVVAAVAIVAIAGFSLTACSKSNKAKTANPNVSAPSQAAQGNGGAGSAGASAPGGGGGNASADAGGDTLLANGPACQMVTAADIQAAVGMPLGNITGRHQRRPARGHQLPQLHLDQGRIRNRCRRQRRVRNLRIRDQRARVAEGN